MLVGWVFGTVHKLNHILETGSLQYNTMATQFFELGNSNPQGVSSVWVHKKMLLGTCVPVWNRASRVNLPNFDGISQIGPCWLFFQNLGRIGDAAEFYFSILWAQAKKVFAKKNRFWPPFSQNGIFLTWTLNSKWIFMQNKPFFSWVTFFYGRINEMKQQPK